MDHATHNKIVSFIWTIAHERTSAMKAKIDGLGLSALENINGAQNDNLDRKASVWTNSFPGHRTLILKIYASLPIFTLLVPEQMPFFVEMVPVSV